MKKSMMPDQTSDATGIERKNENEFTIEGCSDEMRQSGLDSEERDESIDTSRERDERMQPNERKKSVSTASSMKEELMGSKNQPIVVLERNSVKNV